MTLASQTVMEVDVIYLSAYDIHTCKYVSMHVHGCVGYTTADDVIRLDIL